MAAIGAIATVAALSMAVGGPAPSALTAAAGGCPPGFRMSTPTSAERTTTLNRAGALTRPLLRALDGQSRPTSDRLCVRTNSPESRLDLAASESQRMFAAAAPAGSVPPGLRRAAVATRQQLLGNVPTVAGANGSWTPIGTTPLIADSASYPSVNGEGLADLAGRIDSYDYDPVNHRLFATVGTGGVWMSTDVGSHWRSIGDRLPGQETGAVAWTPARGGTLVVAGGEPLAGGNTYAGLGAFWTTDLGATWHQAIGVPDGVMAFQVAVDPANPLIVYVATSLGLYRSVDGARHFGNVYLPVPFCHGVNDYTYSGRCQFANWVTDVVVQAPGGTTQAAGGTVLAAVGYRAGRLKFPNGVVQSPGNGLYKSTTGAAGSFVRLNNFGDGISPVGFALQNHIGRTELGSATGPQQDHNYVYAIVEDAVLFNSGIPVIDVNEGAGLGQIPADTVLNGVYVSADFGSTWTRMGDDNSIAHNPTTGSALTGAGTAMLYSPGAQSWYDMWIKPDPTRQNANGVPTRLAFGMEEVWTNLLPVAMNGPTAFHVIGPYFSGDSCQFSSLGIPVCPTTGTMPGETTTHPDQHEGIFLPDTTGAGVTLVVGNDGGAYRQHTAGNQGLSKTRWGRGVQNGFHTLLPYDGEPAGDGTVWFGLQDNGSGKITPQGTQYMTYGGDGFYMAVDPNNSNHAYSEVTQASMRVTTDGGKTWRDMGPSLTSPQFANPFVMDPTDANHLLTAGQEIVETTYGVDTGTTGKGWATVFNLGAPNQMSSVDVQGDAAYVGFCGTCGVLNHYDPGFHSGLATNVGGSAAPKRMTSQGWHKAARKGLPNRGITSIAIDPQNPRTVYVTLGGYDNREWAGPHSYLDANKAIGSGHVFVSHNAGASFTNVSGNLPDTETSWVEIHGTQLVVGTDIGVFISSDVAGSNWATLGGGALPATPITSIRPVPGATNLLIVATFGRGVYCYQFPGPGTATCTNRGANFRPPGSGGSTGGGLATTGLPIGVGVLASLLVGMGLVVARVRRRRAHASP
jgi:hypothetical protein